MERYEISGKTGKAFCRRLPVLLDNRRAWRNAEIGANWIDDVIGRNDPPCSDVCAKSFHRSQLVRLEAQPDQTALELLIEFQRAVQRNTVSETLVRCSGA
jgi:hypothetical protein